MQGICLYQQEFSILHLLKETSLTRVQRVPSYHLFRLSTGLVLYCDLNIEVWLNNFEVDLQTFQVLLAHDVLQHRAQGLYNQKGYRQFRSDDKHKCEGEF